eukprot:gene8036-9440_t
MSAMKAEQATTRSHASKPPATSKQGTTPLKQTSDGTASSIPAPRVAGSKLAPMPTRGVGRTPPQTTATISSMEETKSRRGAAPKPERKKKDKMKKGEYGVVSTVATPYEPIESRVDTEYKKAAGLPADIVGGTEMLLMRNLHSQMEKLAQTPLVLSSHYIKKPKVLKSEQPMAPKAPKPTKVPKKIEKMQIKCIKFRDPEPALRGDWTIQDDHYLLDLVQRHQTAEAIATSAAAARVADPANIHRHFSRDFTAEEIGKRWRAILYEDRPSAESASMMALHPAATKAPPLSEEELAVLVKAPINLNRPTFQHPMEMDEDYNEFDMYPFLYHKEELEMVNNSQWEPILSVPPESIHEVESDIILNPYLDIPKFITSETPKDDYNQHYLTLLIIDVAPIEIRDLKQIIKVEHEYDTDKERDFKTLALIRGETIRYYMKSKDIIVGRDLSARNLIDLDLREENENNVRKVSKKHLIIKLKSSNATFVLQNIGKNGVFVNGVPVAPNQTAVLQDLSLIEHNPSELMPPLRLFLDVSPRPFSAPSFNCESTMQSP